MCNNFSVRCCTFFQCRTARHIHSSRAAKQHTNSSSSSKAYSRSLLLRRAMQPSDSQPQPHTTLASKLTLNICVQFVAGIQTARFIQRNVTFFVVRIQCSAQSARAYLPEFCFSVWCIYIVFVSVALNARFGIQFHSDIGF